MAVHLEPVGADQVLLVEHGVVRTQKVEILELKETKKLFLTNFDFYTQLCIINQRGN